MSATEINSQEVPNNTAAVLTKPVTLSTTFTEERFWQNDAMISLGNSARVQVSVPEIIEGSAYKISQSTGRNSAVIGDSYREQKTWSNTQQVQVPPGETALCTASSRKASFDVPFTARWRSKKTGQLMETSGMYHGTDINSFEAGSAVFDRQTGQA